MSSEVTVVGAGVIGLATAYYLAKQGAAVRVLEARRIGRGASWGNGGWISPSLAGPLPARGVPGYALRSIGKPGSAVHLVPRADPELARWAWGFCRRCNDRDHVAGVHATARLGARSHELYDALAADGVDFRHRRNGLVMASLDRHRAEQELDHLRLVEEYGYPVPDRLLDGAELAAAEPFLSAGVAAGFVVEGESHVDPASLTRGLAAAVRALGGEILEGAEVTAVDRSGRRSTRLHTTAGQIETEQVLLAAGAWSAPLGGMLGARVPVQAGKGYSFSTEPATPPARPLYLLDAKVAVTPLWGRVRFAGVMELSGLNLRLDRRRIDAIVAGARPFAAEWPAGPVRDPWVGMRPVAPDGLPVLGRLPGYDNVYVATGHAMSGITLAPASGLAMADLILTGRQPDVLRPFAPERFG